MTAPPKPTKKEIELEASKLQNLVDTVLDTIVDGVITINERGEIQSYNKACVKLFGYAPEEVLGQNVNILMPEPYRREHDGYVHNYLTSGVAKIIGIGREVSGQRKDGTVFPMELAVGRTAHAQRHAFVGIIRDTSERKQAEEEREQLRQAQKMEALGQLTGGIAHDFNNLLAVILGNLDFLHEKTGENHPLREYILPCISAAEHGAELTQQLLAFGRKQALQPCLVSLNELTVSFARMASRTLGERIEIVMSLAPDLWNCFVDPRQLENALLNLSINARDAMPKGGKIIYETKNTYLDDDYVTAHIDIPPGEYVMIAVSDTGMGMTREVLGKAFDPFFTTKEPGKGTGLGLSMVYGLIKQSAGHIKLYSEPGQGTTVRIYLPRNTDISTRQERPSTETIVHTGNKDQLILIVEDNQDVLKLTSSMVESLGYSVIVASSGEQALKILQGRQDIDLLLSDVMLSGNMNGPALAQEAIKLHPGLKVLFNSGYAEHAIFQSGLLEEGVQLLSKPFRKQQLAEKIAEILRC